MVIAVRPDSPPESLPTWDTLLDEGPRIAEAYSNRDETTGLWSIPRRRWAFILEYAYAVPTRAAIEQIAQFCAGGGGIVLEVGAGSGLWAGLLAAAATTATVVATDNYSWANRRDESTDEYIHCGRYYPVEEMDGAHAIRKYAPDVLLLCWPPYSDSMAVRCLRAFKGDRVVYIGEGPGGCTADSVFHDQLAEQFELVAEIDIPAWTGIHDSVYLYRRAS